MTPTGLQTATLVVRDYDEARDWFIRCLGFSLVQDIDLGSGKRWLVLETGGGANLLMALAANDQQQAAIGNQTGGRVAFFLHKDDFIASEAHMRAKGVNFIEPMREEAYGKVAQFEDLYSNRWDLIESIS